MAIIITAEVDVSRVDGEILREVIARIQPRLQILANVLVPEVRSAIAVAMRNTPEYPQLLSGELQREFGLEDSAPVLDSVVAAVQESVRATVLPPRGDYLGGVWLGAFRSDFSDALGASGAQYVSHSRRGSVLVPWLRWLLFEGDAVVLAEWGILRYVEEKFSRTGSHIMVRRKEGGKLAPWRVPPAFAGTKESNWLTKAAQLAARPIQDVIVREAQRILS